jgi:deazaflavin-dependent oxidoreductase (nitroreductase family)
MTDTSSSRPSEPPGPTSPGRPAGRTTVLQRTLGPVFQRISGSDWFAAVGPAIVPRLDRVLHRVSGGRFLMSQALVPSLVLTTVGSVSGRPRQAPLACMPEPDGGFIVVGSNFGREKHPAWTTNLLKTPEAVVSHRGRTIQVTAALVEGEERAEVWPRLLKIWPVYDRYVEKVDREIRVFRLSPVAR